MSNCLLWFRRDLRLNDNPALQVLVDNGHTPVAVYIHDEPDPQWPLGAASAWWLHHSLQSLRTSLLRRGSDLLVVSGDSLNSLLQLIEDTEAIGVYWNRCYEPACIQRDQQIKETLTQQGFEARSFNGSLLREPWQHLKKDDTPYRVFTPFWKALNKSGPSRTVVRSSIVQTQPPQGIASLQQGLEALHLLPEIGWDSAFHDHWKPGEDNAWNTLQNFCNKRLLKYATRRDLPAEPATSCLSPYLHFGEISPVQIWEFVNRWASTSTVSGAYTAAESWLRQLAWREFSYHLLYHFPHTPLQPLDARFERFPWRDDAGEDLARWQQGQTGIPLVDAGMRQLWTTGYLHNRVRMIVASFLTKNLLIPWREGARWFWDTLVDADLANNTAGWQWTAGCGADAAPYFRVFNPVLQGEKFDSSGNYVRRWIPELAELPDKYIHRPWTAEPSVLAKAGVQLGDHYPEPLTELRSSREAALAAWEAVKQQRG
jgi:deoxyribodipyrimidine photo-lyase